MDGKGTLWRRNISENFNRLSRAHERYTFAISSPDEFLVIYRTNFSCLSRFAPYIVHTVAFVSCVSLKKVDDDDPR